MFQPESVIRFGFNIRRVCLARRCDAGQWSVLFSGFHAEGHVWMLDSASGRGMTWVRPVCLMPQGLWRLPRSFLRHSHAPATSPRAPTRGPAPTVPPGATRLCTQPTRRPNTHSTMIDNGAHARMLDPASGRGMTWVRPVVPHATGGSDVGRHIPFFEINIFKLKTLIPASPPNNLIFSALRHGAFCVAKWAVSQCNMAYIASRNGPFRRAKRRVLKSGADMAVFSCIFATIAGAPRRHHSGGAFGLS